MRKRILQIGVALACLLCLIPAAALAAAPGEITLTVKQALTNAGAETFTYRLVPKQASNPMPAGSGEDGYTFAITGTGEKNIGPITFKQAGVYAYVLSRITACACPREAYALKVYVEKDLSVSVVAAKPDGTKAMDLQFEHACGKPVETTKPETTTPATKPPADNGPKTSDEFQTELYIILLCVAGIAVLGSIIYLLAGRRRGKEGDTDET